jgi:hypothetical protein
VHERDASIANCPTSNLFLGSGLFRLRIAKDRAADPCRPRHRYRRRYELLPAADNQRDLQDRGAERCADHGLRGALSRHARRRARSDWKIASARLRLAERPTSWCSTPRPRRFLPSARAVPTRCKRPCSC